MYVVESRHLLIVLGDTFLRQHQTVLNFARNIIQLKPYSTVYAAKRTVLGPRTETIVECDLDGPLPEGTIGLIEPLPQSSTLRERGVSTIESVSKVGGERTYVGLVNDTDRYMVVRKNTKVALFSCLPPGTRIMSGMSDREPPSVGSQRVEKGEPTQLISNDEFLSRFDLKGTDLLYHERVQLQELLIQFKDVFSDTDGKVGHYTGEYLSVNVSNDAKPVRKSPYSVHPRHEPALRKELEMMQRENIIRESRSAWSSPAIVIPKPGRPGDIRLVVDYKEVNKLIEKDSHPLPCMDRCLDQVGRSRPRFMTSLDLEKGFFQMELDEDSKKYTAFSVPHNLFEFNRLPMGLSTSPAQFQRCMNHTFRDYINQFMVIYLDDLLYSKTFEEHLEVLSLVFNRLRQANPAGTWHHFDVKQTLKLSHDVEKPDINVILTSMCLRRIDVKSTTSIRR